MNNKHKVANLSQKKRYWAMLGILTAFLALLVSIYTFNHHTEVKLKGTTDAICNINAIFNCDAVAASRYSELWGVPLGIWGIGYFLSLIVLWFCILFSANYREPCFRAVVILSYIGLGVCAILAAISIFMIKSLCLSCISVYILTFTQFLWIVALGSEYLRPKKDALGPLFLAALVVGMTAFLYEGLFAKENYQASNFTPLETKNLLKPSIEDLPIDRNPYSDRGEDYRLGPEDAPVVIQKFSDFQCPACKHMAEFLHNLSKDYEGKILLVFRNFPLDKSCNQELSYQIHDKACEIATIARCSGQIGAFWKFYGLAFSNQESKDPNRAKLWGREVGLDDAQIQSCLLSKNIAQAIKEDIALASRVKVYATPTVYINGQAFVGDRENMRHVIDSILAH